MLLAMNRPLQILVLSADPARVRRWSQFLADRDTQVWEDASEFPRDRAPDLIVTDGSRGLDVSAGGSLLEAWPGCEVGVVAIAPASLGDVVLPADVTPRELRLACRLLAEVVRWRRECHCGRQLQQALSQLAFTDPLTGLPNRRAWDEQLRARTARGAEDTSSVCLAVFDVDLFKSINDRFGHIAGDEILCHIGRRLAAARRESDLVARLGGDEFALLLEGRNAATAAADLEALRTSACAGTPHLKVTACIGFALSPVLPSVGLDALFEEADVALRCAKLSGRNRTVAARP